MRVLLDTRAMYWYVEGDPQLSATAQTLIQDTSNEVLASPASFWEIATKMGILMLKRPALVWCVSCLALVFFVPASPLAGADPIQKGEMAGYLLVPNEKVEQTYNAGFSMYVAAWPLLQEYPGHRFQTGLFGTWMHAQYDASNVAGRQTLFRYRGRTGLVA